MSLQTTIGRGQDATKLAVTDIAELRSAMQMCGARRRPNLTAHMVHQFAVLTALRNNAEVARCAS